MMRPLCWLSLLLLLGAVQAQRDSGHTLSVALPTLMQIRYGDQLAQQVVIPVTATIQNGVYELTPKSSTLHIRSNTDWQLLASFEPQGPDTSLRFVAKLQSTWQRVKPYLTTFTAGQKTSNWQALKVDYGLEAPLPSKGTYQGILTYTLIHP
jgi:hypothetical protein